MFAIFFRKSLFFAMIFSVKTLLPQQPPAPDFCYLTVNQDSTVTIHWNMQNPEDIDGYIIKRKIIDGQGVVEGTFNNVAIIDNPNTFTFTDTSTAYNTFAKPWLRKETYRIASYKTINDSVYYGIATQVHSTIYLQAVFKKCDKKIFLSWNQYAGREVEKYVIFYDTGNGFKVLKSLDDTVYSFTPQVNTDYRFYVAAVLKSTSSCSADTSYSNLTNVFTDSPVFPDTLAFCSLNFIDNTNFELNFIYTPGKDLKEFFIKNSFNDTLRIWQPSENLKTIKASKRENNCYFLVARDSCLNEKSSASVCAIDLEISQQNNKILLQWSKGKIFGREVNFYNIFVKEDDSFRLLTTTNDTSFEANILKELKINAGNPVVSFQIKGIRDTSLCSEAFTTSPVEDFVLKPVVFLPNAIRPSSRNEENRFFKPKLFFYKTMELTIFDATGGIIFRTTDNNTFWDGTVGGKLLPAGEYYYVLKITAFDGETEILKGAILLVR